MTTMDRDAQIMAEAEKQREHEARIEKIKATALQEQARQETIRTESRHSLVGGVLIGVGIVVVLLGLFGAMLYGVTDGRKDQQQRERQRNEIAQTCIREGNIWLNGNCIPAQKN